MKPNDVPHNVFEDLLLELKKRFALLEFSGINEFTEKSQIVE